MTRPPWSALVALRAQRVEAALIQHGQARRRSIEAGRMLDEAASAFDAAERQRTSLQQAIYASMADRPLSAREVLNMRDSVHAIAHETEVDRAHVLDLAEERDKAGRAAQEALALHRERMRAAEKAQSVQSRLADRRNRRDEIHLEVELEDLAATFRWNRIDAR